MTQFGYHIKSKHDVFSDGTEQKCLSFSQVSFWDGTNYLQIKDLSFHCATQWDMHEISFTLSFFFFFFVSSFSSFLTF